tara:strand:+ start:269 stop:412 length:144 start_codon:yes stop_codon:yes gene_type:complete
MNKYWVEFINDGVGNGDHICIYVYAYSTVQVKEMFIDYELIACDRTD